MTENVLSILAWLAGSVCCGLLPLGFAAILFFTARKRGQVGSAVGAARKGTVAELQAGGGLRRLQGRIAALANPIDGATENGVAYLRLKVEVYERDLEETSGWRGLTEQARSIPFQFEDGSGAVWVNPDGLDKQMLGEGVVPDENQIQAACVLLGISPKILRGQLRYRMWELRAGQSVTVVGPVVQGENGLEVRRVQGQPFIISPLVGQAVDANISSQTKKARIWMLVLGIPGAIMLVCTLGGALIAVIRALTAK